MEETIKPGSLVYFHTDNGKRELGLVLDVRYDMEIFGSDACCIILPRKPGPHAWKLLSSIERAV